jgi:hypothetical protein
MQKKLAMREIVTTMGFLPGCPGRHCRAGRALRSEILVAVYGSTD